MYCYIYKNMINPSKGNSNDFSQRNFTFTSYLDNQGKYHLLTIRESIITCMNLLEINFSYGFWIPRYEITLKSYILNSILKWKQRSKFNIQFELNSIVNSPSAINL